MRCSEFRDLHDAYVDDTLAGVELVRVQRHISVCPSCAEYDTRVRRAMMLVRSLPSIEPSADFTRRLEARLAECRGESHAGTAYRSACSFRVVATAGAVASLAMLAYVADVLHTPGEHPRDVVLQPAVAAVAGMARTRAEGDPAPELEATRRAGGGAHGHGGASVAAALPTSLLDVSPPGALPPPAPAPAIVASVSAGVPIWPVALLTEPGAVHFATYSETH